MLKERTYKTKSAAINAANAVMRKTQSLKGYTVLKVGSNWVVRYISKY